MLQRKLSSTVSLCLICKVANNLNIVDALIAIGNYGRSGPKDNGLFAAVCRIGAGCKQQDGRKGRGFTFIYRVGFKTNEQ